MKIKRVDHLILTVTDIARAIRFYHEVFDMPIINFKDKREPHCVRCGHQLLEFQTVKQPQQPAATNPTVNSAAATNPTVNSAAFCIITGDKLSDVCNHLESYYVPIVAGPLKQIGSEGPMMSIYIHDCDQNLIEISSYQNK
ncbi:MAG: VOC family protein [Liquorilactobacillus ghanensis]|uniref:VOC family protein n=1 Tax=Liquorilactobacillus ghanensis TaxID=399370 RepID=UPI0039E8B875